ncbi:MAG TPA: hypothetical protein VFS80_09840 [Burkholderiales bacterium]|nr:hypothetical protein [Burkholderiales bacterium]
MKKEELSKALGLMRKGDWEAAHLIVQKDEESPLACWAHGIVHLMEGDASNARYWYRAAKRKFPEELSIPDEIDSLDEALRS